MIGIRNLAQDSEFDACLKRAREDEIFTLTKRNLRSKSCVPERKPGWGVIEANGILLSGETRDWFAAAVLPWLCCEVGQLLASTVVLLVG